MRFIKQTGRFIFFILVTGFLFYLLLLCLRVRSFDHYVFVSYSSSSYNDTNCINARITYNLSNLNETDKTSFEFLSKRSAKRPDVLAPQHYSLSGINQLAGISIDKLSVYATKANIPVDSISNLYNVVLFETNNDQSVTYKEQVSPRRGDVLIHREYLVGQEIKITHEHLLEQALKYTVDKESKYDTDGPFQIDIQNFVINSYSILTSKFKEVKTVHETPRFSGLRLLVKIFEPYDITREDHKFVFHTQAVDTLGFIVKFDEKVETSPMNRTPSYNNYQEIVFDDITTHGETKYDAGTKYLYSDIKQRSATFHISYYQQKARENTLSFWVKYVSSEKLQWFRLFFLTTVLGYCITRLIILMGNFIHFCLQFISSRKNNKSNDI